MITDQTPVAFDDALPEAVDVAIVGAGIAGTATAYFQAKHGTKVLLCPKGRVAGEQSSRNWGWVRQQGRDRAELPIMMEANRIWRGLAAETGEADLAFTLSGCVYLVEDEAQLRKHQGWHDLAKQHQLDTKMLTKAEIAQRFPDLGGDWLAAMGGRVAGVVTERGRVRCDRVLLAAGAWSSHFAANAGIDLPQLAVRSTVARTEPVPAAPYENNLNTPDLSIRRRADGGYTVATGDGADHYLSANSFKYFVKFLKIMRLSTKDVHLHLGAPKGYPGAWGTPRRWSADAVSPFERMRVLDPAASPLVVRRIVDRLPKRFPALAGVKLAETWAGMIDVTPDAVPTLGEEPGLPGLFYATGLSGHGFGIGPAIGRVMADLLTARPPGHDLARFRPQRFFDGSEIVPGPY